MSPQNSAQGAPAEVITDPPSIPRSNDPQIELLEEILVKLGRLEKSNEEINHKLTSLEANFKLVRVEIRNHGNLIGGLVKQDLNTTPQPEPIVGSESAVGSVPSSDITE